METFAWIADPDDTVQEKYKAMGGVGLLTLSSLQWTAVEGLPFKVKCGSIISSRFQVIVFWLASTTVILTPQS